MIKYNLSYCWFWEDDGGRKEKTQDKVKKTPDRRKESEEKRNGFFCWASFFLTLSCVLSLLSLPSFQPSFLSFLSFGDMKKEVLQKK